MRIETKFIPSIDEKGALSFACDFLDKIRCDHQHCSDCPFCMVITKTKWDNDIIATQCSIKWIKEVKDIWDDDIRKD
jgi:hypothetical protein